MNRLIIVSLLLLTMCGELRQPLPEDERLAWWDEARFGMFIHWGLYAIPAGTWNGEQVPELGEWIMAHADIPVEEYEKLAPQFNPENFDAAEWVRMAKEAGMKYLVITTRHHDGFSLFDTKHSDWDVMDATPFKRDIIKELSDECKKAGIKFGAYYSILEWHHHAMELNTDFSDLDPFSDEAIEEGGYTRLDTTWRKYGNVNVKPELKEDFIDYMKDQIKELIDKYDPSLIWFDGGWVDWWTPEDGKQLLEYIWDLNPKMVVNNRAGEDFENDTWYGDYGTPEQFIPNEGLDYRWESCMTMNSTWGYKSYDQNWKPTQMMVLQLVDIIAKGGNLLLNVGPKADGTFPLESIKSLEEISAWMNVNGEYVSGTSMWKVYSEGNFKMEEEYYDSDDVGSVKLPVTAADFRFSAKDKVIYAACLDWPENGSVIKSLGNSVSPEINIKNITMLGSDEQILWKRDDKGLKVSAPMEKPCDYVYVYKIITE